MGDKCSLEVGTTNFSTFFGASLEVNSYSPSSNSSATFLTGLGVSASIEAKFGDCESVTESESSSY